MGTETKLLSHVHQTGVVLQRNFLSVFCYSSWCHTDSRAAFFCKSVSGLIRWSEQVGFPATAPPPGPSASSLETLPLQQRAVCFYKPAAVKTPDSVAALLFCSWSWRANFILLLKERRRTSSKNEKQTGYE